MLFILSHPFRLRATPPAGRSGSRGGQADSRSSFLVKRTSPTAKRRPLATLFVSASAQAWFFVSSRNLRALGALRGFAVNPGLDFHREGAKHAKKTRRTLVWLELKVVEGGFRMPESGQRPIPKKLLQKGARDMLRISDSRAPGTS